MVILNRMLLTKLFLITYRWKGMYSWTPVKPEYDWTPLNWYVNPDLPDNVINQQPSSVIADLMGVMEHIITEGEEEAYQSEIQYRNAKGNSGDL